VRIREEGRVRIWEEKGENKGGRKAENKGGKGENKGGKG